MNKKCSCGISGCKVGKLKKATEERIRALVQENGKLIDMIEEYRLSCHCFDSWTCCSTCHKAHRLLSALLPGS